MLKSPVRSVQATSYREARAAVPRPYTLSAVYFVPYDSSVRDFVFRLG